MLDLIDDLLELLEPGGAMDAVTGIRTATSGTSVDHTGAQPFELEFAPDRLYAWPGRDSHETFEAGDPPSIRERFEVIAYYVADSGDEQAASRRLRSVSTALDTKAHAYMAIVAANQAPTGPGAPWGNLGGEINPDVVRGFDVRGVALRLTGWRQLH